MQKIDLNDPVIAIILQELSMSHPKPVKAVDLKRKLANVKASTYYSLLGRLVENGIIQPVKKGRMSTYELTEKGRSVFRNLNVSTSYEAYEIGVLTEEVEGNLQESLLKIREIAKRNVYLYIGRKHVWDTLAKFYDRATKEIRVMAGGADLSKDDVKKDISQLLDSNMRLVNNPKKIFKRVQPVDTWTSWLDFLYELEFDSQKGSDRTTVEVYFTDKKPEFVPQLNIKDNDEVILVPFEESPSTGTTHSFHIMEPELVDSYLKKFANWENSSSRFRVDSPTLGAFISCLRALRRLQAQCFVLHTFSMQKMLNLSETKFNSLFTYEVIERYFPIDWTLYNEVFVEWMHESGLSRLADFVSQKEQTIGGALQEVFSEDYKKDKPIDSLISETFPGVAIEALTQEQFKSYLNRKISKEACKDFIAYLSEKMSPNLLDTIIEKTQ